ncbi:MAG: SAM-dependent methyltransferase [Candidatus Arcticimaribacter sp.]|nr:MAG: SAM-dependent methyltransferase [Candidatus Arcticimaribacter sp.]PTM02455.1 MAG: SAM-dependent methyltransferase [Candidatus Arcticimaribacter sp.]
MENTNQAPEILEELIKKAQEINFEMGTDYLVGELLQTLVTSKPNGHFLELGTGMGLSTTWIYEGMDEQSKLVSIDNDPKLMDIVTRVFEAETRIEFITTDGGSWIRDQKGAKFDLIFADAWPGKYSDLDRTLELLNPGGFYVIDDMLPQPNWPKGHDLKVDQLMQDLKSKVGFKMTVMNWSTGVVILTKTK